MKKFNLLTKTLLMTVGLFVGTSVTWAATETVGASTNDASFRSSNSTVYTLAGNGSVNLKFNMTNAATEHYHTYTLCVNDGSSAGATNDYFCIMDMHYAYNGDKGTAGNSNANPTVYALTNNYAGPDLKAALNGAAVDLTVSRAGTAVSVSATFTPTNGEAAWTSTFSYAADGGISSNNIGVYLTVENTYVYDLFAVTTKTYDFTQMSTATPTTLTASATNLGKERSAYAYVPNELTSELEGRFAFQFVGGATITVSTEGLKHVNSEKTSRSIGIVLAELTEGDQFIENHTGTLTSSAASSSRAGSGFTYEGTDVYNTSPDNLTLTSGGTCFATGTKAYFMLLHNSIIEDITVKKNTSTNYATLYSEWRSKAAIYAEAEASAAKTALGTAVAAAKTALTNANATETDYFNAIEALKEAYDLYYATAIGNTTYSVTMSDKIYGGKAIKSVTGITMTYGGTTGVAWTLEEPKDSKGISRGIRARGTANATVVDNIPTEGTWVKFRATQPGILTVKTLFYAGKTTSTKGHAYLSDGTTVKHVEFSSSYKIWTAEFGVIEANKDYYCYFAGGNSDVAGINGFTFETSVSKTITDAGWATLYTPYALNFSGLEGLTAYTATYDDTKSIVTLTPVDDVPANTGVVLEGAADTYNIPVIASSSTPKGDLKGNATEDTAYDAVSGYDLYMLAQNGGNVQFTKVTDGSIAAGKAYLQVAQTGAPALFFDVVFDNGVTGIDAVKNNAAADGQFYNLKGQRISKPTKGLYIVNGKKVVIK